jgi:hypothetical protein
MSWEDHYKLTMIGFGGSFAKNLSKTKKMRLTALYRADFRNRISAAEIETRP